MNLDEKLDVINILVTIDRNYLNPLKIMLQSYAPLHEDVTTHVYVANKALTEADFIFLNESVKGHKIQIIDMKIKERYFADIPILERIPEESFYRLLAFTYLPEEVKKVLYLDPDILIRKSLEELYDTDLTDKYIAACGHMHGFLNFLNRIRLGCMNQKRYLNSGIVLMNLEAIRSDFSLEYVLETLEKNKQRLVMGDQDMTNILFGEKCVVLDERLYNLDERTYKYYFKRKKIDLAYVEEKTVIIHYNGKFKPWLLDYEGVLDRYYPEVSDKKPMPEGIRKRQFKSIMNILRPTKRQIIMTVGILLATIAIIALYIFLGKNMIDMVRNPEGFQAWIEQFGVFDEVIFVIIRSFQTAIKFLPSQLLEVVSGYTWGIWGGMLLCIIGNTLGSILVFVLVKKYGTKLLDILLPVDSLSHLEFFKKSKRLYLLIFLLYLIPGLPKDGFTYFIALLPVRLLPFLIITGIARVPSVLMSTYAGKSLASQNYLIFWIMMALIIILTIIGIYAYRAYMKKHNPKKRQEENKTEV